MEQLFSQLPLAVQKPSKLLAEMHVPLPHVYRRTTPSSTACFSTSCRGSSPFYSPKQPWPISRHWAPGRIPIQPTTARWLMTWVAAVRSRKERTPSVHPMGTAAQLSARQRQRPARCKKPVLIMKKYGRNGDGNVIYSPYTVLPILTIPRVPSI